MEEIIEFKYRKPILPHCPNCNCIESIFVDGIRLFACGRELKNVVLNGKPDCLLMNACSKTRYWHNTWDEDTYYYGSY